MVYSPLLMSCSLTFISTLRTSLIRILPHIYAHSNVFLHAQSAQFHPPNLVCYTWHCEAVVEELPGWGKK